MYRDGQGLPQDTVQASVWFRGAAEQGYAPAQYNLGAMYHDGEGVAQDFAESYFWLDLAASGKVENISRKYVEDARDDSASYLSNAAVLQTRERVRKWRESHHSKTTPQ
jgi:hypothetical protein